MHAARIFLLAFFLAGSSGSSVGAVPFLKTFADPQASSYLRIVATPDDGWAVFFTTTFRLYKFNSCGQMEWAKSYNVPPTTWNSNDFIAVPGGFAFMTRINNGFTDVSLVVRLDASGQVVWSNTYGDTQYDRFPYTLSKDATGNIVLFENISHHTSSPFFMTLSKIGPAGNVLWARQYDPRYTWGGAIATSDNGMLARTSHFFVKVDVSGAVQWTSTFSIPGTYEYFAPIEVADGYIFTTRNTPGNSINFHKIDKQGNNVWTQYKSTDVLSTVPLMRKHPNGNFVAVFSREWIEFDKDLQVIRQGAVDASLNLASRDICFLSNNDAVVAGVATGQWFIARTEGNYELPCSQTVPAPVISPGNQTFSTVWTGSALTTLQVNPLTVSGTDISLVAPTVCRLPLALDLGPDTALCGNTSITLHDINGTDFDEYRWSTGDTTASITITTPGTYSLLAMNACGEDSLIDSVTVTMLPAAQAGLGPDRFLCDDSTTLLQPPACGDCLFSWSTGSSAAFVLAEETGTYWITVEAPGGCTAYDTINILPALCDCSFYLPSAFTPNHDGRNDSFSPVFHCEVEDFFLEIYDRWGKLVFTTSDPSIAWDGRLQSRAVETGLYPYRLQYTPVVMGRPELTVQKTGTVTVYY